MGVYTLPELSYDYGALEPHISGRIMELHHSKHHQAYVTGANTALEQLAEARDKGDFATVNQLEKNLAFNLGGHVNHTAFGRTSHQKVENQRVTSPPRSLSNSAHLRRSRNTSLQ